LLTVTIEIIFKRIITVLENFVIQYELYTGKFVALLTRV